MDNLVSPKGWLSMEKDGSSTITLNHAASLNPSTTVSFPPRASENQALIFLDSPVPMHILVIVVVQ